MFISLKRYKKVMKSYGETVEANGRILDLAQEVNNDNAKLIEICKQLLDENKALRAENVKLKQTKVNITQRELEEINRQKNELLFDSELSVNYESTKNDMQRKDEGK